MNCYVKEARYIADISGEKHVFIWVFNKPWECEGSMGFLLSPTTVSVNLKHKQGQCGTYVFQIYNFCSSWEKWISQEPWQACTFITHADNGFLSVLGFQLMTRVTWMTVSPLTATYCFNGYTTEKLPANSLSNKYMARRSYSSHIKAYGGKYNATKALLINFYTPNQTITKRQCVITKLFPPLYILFSIPSLSLASESGKHTHTNTHKKNIHCSSWVDI